MTKINTGGPMTPQDAALIAAAPDLHRIATEQAAEIERLRDALQQVLHHCRNTGRGSEMVDARIVERCEDTATLAVQP